MGLPITAYWSGMMGREAAGNRAYASPRLLLVGNELVGRSERPRARDVQHVRVLRDLRRERRERRGELDNPPCCFIEHTKARRPVDLDVFHAPVSLDRDRDDEGAEQSLIARGL